MTFINVSNYSFSYGDKKTLNDLSFSLPQNTITAILGPSGSGKTTLLRLLAGFEKPQTGRYELDQSLMNDLSPFKRQTGFVFQDLALFPHLTISENINYGLNSQFQSLNYWLDLFDLGDLQHRYPHQISGGQKQRVALARSLAAKPKLMLFDEAFSALDQHLRLRLLKEVKSLLKKFEITTLMVTHDQEEAFIVADQFALLNQGQLIQLDSPEKVYRFPKSLFAAQFLGELNCLEVEDQKTFFGRLDFSGSESLYFRPESCRIHKEGQLKGTILTTYFTGHQYLYELERGLKVSSKEEYVIGKEVNFSIDMNAILLFS